ncbi:TetR/AcrR family transcriptional regulator [Aquibacillus saliphilus]|uniref:TetR/AcrR family transcriptional regulator n=1 Tax=Aquibacillus saliphilus TaxID=1909422 RepID=UPI001CF072F2|nr:TetR/AcrR family transcriptional regulator [Aquibacillus saliphilus]
MPKITFHNLSEEKRRLLLDAVQKEFSRVPLFQASIANIIKTAKIPRGSFYQYFEDKEDAYFYLLNKLTLQTNNKFLWILKKNDGNLFEAMPEFFQTMIEEDDNFNFLKNAFLNMNHKIENSLSEMFTKEENEDKFDVFREQIKRSNLNVTSDEELLHLMKIISAVTFHNFIDKFSKELSNEKALNNYKIQMSLLKNGLIRN